MTEKPYARKPLENAPSSRYFMAASLDRFSPREESDHHVEAQRHQFQTDEQRDQVRARGQEEHAALREQDQRVIFAVMLALDLQILVRDDRDNDQRRSERSS